MQPDGYLAAYDALVRADPPAAQARLAGWLRTDWRDLFAELRADRPVLAAPSFTLVTRHADVVHVLSRPASFQVSAYRPAMEAALGAPIMLTRDGTPMNWREKGLMQADGVLVQAERKLMARADSLVVLADSSKFRASASFVLCPLSEVDILVTDDGIGREDLAFLKGHEIEVIVAE